MSARVLSLVSLVIVVLPSAVSAQRTDLSVTGFPIVFPMPTGADFQAGYIESPTPTTFTVDAQSGGLFQLRNTTVSIRCRTPCPAAGTKALGSLQWRRADQATWQTLTLTDSPVETRQVMRFFLNDPWSNSIYWRFLLDWDSDPPNPLNRFDVVFTLTVTS